MDKCIIKKNSSLEVEICANNQNDSAFRINEEKINQLNWFKTINNERKYTEKLVNSIYDKIYLTSKRIL